MNKSFKVLAIGNSFSCDAMEYLFRVADSAGEKNIVLGNLYIPGCTVDIHNANAQYGAPVYQYYKNTDGQWKSTMWYTSERAIKEENWDYITVQQGSGSSGQREAYSHLSELAEFVCRLKPEKTKLAWNMTWAYQGDSDHVHFYRYGHDQLKMYSAITDAVQSCVMTIKEFETVIPCGTTIQNMRAGSFGDTLTRDGYHLSVPLGRYAAAMTFYAALSENPVSKIKCDLSGLIGKKELAEMKRCVSNAILSPFSVTKITDETT